MNHPCEYHYKTWFRKRDKVGIHHSWVYADKEHRTCKKCGRVEFLYRIEPNWDSPIEHWKEYDAKSSQTKAGIYGLDEKKNEPKDS